MTAPSQWQQPHAISPALPPPSRCTHVCSPLSYVARPESVVRARPPATHTTHVTHITVTQTVADGAGVSPPLPGRQMPNGHGAPARPRPSFIHAVAAKGKEQEDAHERVALRLVYLPRPHKERECAATSTHKRFKDKEEEEKKKKIARPRPRTRDAAPDPRPAVGQMPAAET